MSELDSYDLPFATDNAELLSGGSRSRGYKINGWIVRVPTKEEFLLEQKREASISNLLHQELPEKLKSTLVGGRQFSSLHAPYSRNPFTL